MIGRLHIAQAVYAETVGRGRLTADNLLALGNIEHHALTSGEVDDFVQANCVQNLHVGDRESLYLCRHVNVTVLLTDDLAVRQAAKRLGITPVASVGIIARAHHNRTISLQQAEQHILGLYNSSTLFVARTIVDIAIAELRQWAG
jgi:predicted nucleic acid-binding protein